MSLIVGSVFINSFSNYLLIFVNKTALGLNYFLCWIIITLEISEKQYIEENASDNDNKPFSVKSSFHERYF